MYIVWKSESAQAFQLQDEPPSIGPFLKASVRVPEYDSAEGGELIMGNCRPCTRFVPWILVACGV
jgi:hypothetical protein